MKLSDHKKLIGLRKTLVFYHGRAPQGKKTDWVMNEYRLPDNSPLPKVMTTPKKKKWNPQEDLVLLQQVVFSSYCFDASDPCK